jgi:hypothetical protein
MLSVHRAIGMGAAPLSLRLGLALLLGACGASHPEPEEAHEVNRDSVPSLALLDHGSERREDVSSSGSGRRCEEVIDEQRRKAQNDGVSTEEPPEDHAEEIKAVLNQGNYLGSCSVPPSATVEVCAAILDGQAVGVTVNVDPGTESQASCVADAVRRMSFPEHELVSVARTEFLP